MIFVRNSETSCKKGKTHRYSHDVKDSNDLVKKYHEILMFIRLENDHVNYNIFSFQSGPRIELRENNV